MNTKDTPMDKTLTFCDKCGEAYDVSIGHKCLCEQCGINEVDFDSLTNSLSKICRECKRKNFNDLLKKENDTPMDYKPLITIAMQEYADKQNASLKLELQKQKELNAELVSACKYLKGTLTSDRLKCEQPDAIEKLESLIKKSSEI